MLLHKQSSAIRTYARENVIWKQKEKRKTRTKHNKCTKHKTPRAEGKQEKREQRRDKTEKQEI